MKVADTATGIKGQTEDSGDVGVAGERGEGWEARPLEDPPLSRWPFCVPGSYFYTVIFVSDVLARFRREILTSPLCFAN